MKREKGNPPDYSRRVPQTHTNIEDIGVEDDTPLRSSRQHLALCLGHQNLPYLTALGGQA